MLTFPDIKLGHGSGSSLPPPVLALAGVSTIVAVAVSGTSIWLQLRNYRKPLLQRMVVRIMVMVPLYAVASLISLLSLEAAFFIDAIRDIYEAFVIYCFFVLLLDYLGGERSLLILLHGRPPIPAVFPVNLWRSEIDPSDPYTFLFLKRGILQYVQVKPLLAFASLIMKATGTYNEGDFRARSGYLYVSLVYNLSICLALWCLAVFWMCVHNDLKPFRPVPKFLCVKGILFFSFWQSIAVSFLVAVGVITRLGPYTDSEHISLGLTDTLICIEMPFFAAAHMYAFSYRDFTKPPASSMTASKSRRPIYVARMTLGYALRDAVGLKDLVEDTRATLRGEGINYRAFEPSEGGMHIGAARDRRIRAGLRYVAGGKRKYWLPERPDGDDDVTAPLFVGDDAGADDVSPDVHYRRALDDGNGVDNDDGDDDEYALTFGDGLAGPEGADEELYEHAKNYVFGDYLYPVVDVSSEEARWAMWAEEARVVREITSGGFGSRGVGGVGGYGATQSGDRRLREYGEDGLDDERGSNVGGGGVRRDDPSVPSSSRAPRTPSPPMLRKALDRPPATPSRQSPTRSSSRLPHLPQLPRLFTASSAVAPSSSPSPPRVSGRSSRTHAPLVTEDAVDLIVAAPEGLHVPSTSTARLPRSPRSPALIRVWDGLRTDSGAPVQRPVVVEERGDAPDVRRGYGTGVTLSLGGKREEREEEQEQEQEQGQEDRHIATVQTSPYVHAGGYEVETPDEADQNPWA